jgi:hypothetical protein
MHHSLYIVGGRHAPRNELTRSALAVLAGILLVFATQGCAVLGPSAISRGRAAYAEVIAETNAEQSLGLLVRLRYGAPWSLLAVSSVTANVRFNANTRAEIGVGPDASFAGALVPLSGGVAYEENPTISYLPLHGDKHLRQLLSPIPADVLVPVLNSSLDVGTSLALLVTSMNRIPNPAFVATPEAARDDRFNRLAALMGALSRAGVLQFVESATREAGFSLWLHDYTPAYRQHVNELLTLLNVEDAAAAGDGDIFLEVVSSPHSRGARMVSIQTRSVYDLGQIGAAAVDVPEADRSAGLTTEYPRLGLAGAKMTIRRGRERPRDAVATVRFRDWWYYIDGSDPHGKRFFQIFEALLSARLADTVEGARTAPVLTVPVARSRDLFF